MRPSERTSTTVDLITTVVVILAVKEVEIAQYGIFALAGFYLVFSPLVLLTTMLPHDLFVSPGLTKRRLIISHITDCIHVAIFVWFGWMWTALIFAFQMAAIDIIYRKQQLCEHRETSQS